MTAPVGPTSVLERLLPHHLDTYRGSRAALWLCGLVVLLRAVMGLNAIFNGREIAVSADGIPLDTFTPDGARTIVSLFALLGLASVVLALLGLLVLARYRGLLPLLFALFLFQQVARTAILRFLPIPRTGAPPSTVINLLLLAVIVLGLVLSLWERKR